MGRRRPRRRGQSLTEYILIVALIAITAMAVVSKLSQSIARAYQTASARLDGVNSKIGGMRRTPGAASAATGGASAVIGTGPRKEALAKPDPTLERRSGLGAR